MENLERSAAIGDNGHQHTDLCGGVVQESIEVVIFDLRVGEEQNQVGGAVLGDDAVCGDPAADAAVLQKSERRMRHLVWGRGGLSMSGSLMFDPVIYQVPDVGRFALSRSAWDV